MNWLQYFLFLFALPFSSFAQSPITQIEGFLEVYHPLDTTSLFIGQNAGQAVDNSFNNFNTFVGNNAGMSNTAGSYNDFFGSDAGRSNTTGFNNAFFGSFSGNNNVSGSDNAFFGPFSGYNNVSGSDNAFFGTAAGRDNTTGNNNAFFGLFSGLSNTDGSSNAFFGSFSGNNNVSGNNNAFFGRDTGISNTDGSSNAFFGFEAGRNANANRNAFFGFQSGFNSTGGGNSFFGSGAGNQNTTGAGNAFFGDSAGLNNTSGSSNTFLGNSAGLNSQGDGNIFIGVLSGNNFNGNNNVAIGTLAGPPSGQGNVSNRLYINNQQSTNPLIYGEFDNDLITINHKAAASGSGHLTGLRINNIGGGHYWTMYTFTGDGTLGFYKTGDGNEKFIFKTNGDFFADGSINGSSDIHRKEAITSINYNEVLNKITQIPITEWQYKGSEERHIGPMAQDFYAAFGLGLGETTIATVDADGVALAAIKALAQENEKLRSVYTEILERLQMLERKLEELVE